MLDQPVAEDQGVAALRSRVLENAPAGDALARQFASKLSELLGVAAVLRAILLQCRAHVLAARNALVECPGMRRGAGKISRTAQREARNAHERPRRESLTQEHGCQQ